MNIDLQTLFAAGVQYQEHFFSHSLNADLAQLDKQACIVPLPQLGLLAVNGQAGQQFLQGQVTCDLNELTPTNSRLGAHCNPKGRVIISFRLFNCEEQFYLLLPKPMVAVGLKALGKYAMFSKVSLSDASHNIYALGFTGPGIEQALAQVFPTLPAHENELIVYKHLRLCRLAGIWPRLLAFGEFSAIAALWQQLITCCQPVSPSAWELLDIQAGLASVFAATSESFTPHQLNYQRVNAISFNKGCYTGQEIIARMQYLGKLKQHMYRIQTQRLPLAGEAVYLAASKQAAGEIVMAAPAPHGYEALATLQDQAVEQKLCLASGEEVAVGNLPYALFSP